MTAVFSLGVSHHLFKITLCEHIDSMSSKLQENNETNKNLLHKLLCFQMSNTCKRINPGFNYIILKNYITSEGAISHKNVYYQQFPIICYQVSFYANNCFESNNVQCL